MRKICDKDGQVLAIVLRTADYMQSADKRFFSDPADAIQVGSMFFSKDSEVEPHRHNPREGRAAPAEVLLVLAGTLRACIFDEKGKSMTDFSLKVGDILIQRAGGHSFQFTSDTTLLEIKTGPYEGRGSDKAEITG